MSDRKNIFAENEVNKKRGKAPTPAPVRRDKIQESGEYGAVIDGYEPKEDKIWVFLRPYELDDPEVEYQKVIGFLERKFDDTSLTDQFMQSVGEFGDMSELIGCEVGIRVSFEPKKDKFRDVAGYFILEDADSDVESEQADE